jgi:mono/diheme cytochrome c family protein
MKRRITIGFFAVILIASAKPLSAQYVHADQPQGGFAIDSVQANRGKRLFSDRGCAGCHTISKGDLAGPDLGGLLERRTESWVKRWLRDPTTMLASDDIAKGLLKQYDNLRMPNLRLNDNEILALMHYIAIETKAARGEGTGSQ